MSATRGRWTGRAVEPRRGRAPACRAAWAPGAVVLPALLAGLVACANPPLVPPGDGGLAEGTWGGEGAAVVVTDSVAHVHIGCSFGDLPAPVVLDDEGRFTTPGSYVLRAYPVAVGPRLPAEFRGRVAGRTLTLAVTVRDTVEKRVVELGPVTVVYGRKPELGPCPICARPGGRARVP